MANDIKQLTLKIKGDVEKARRDMAALRGDVDKFSTSASGAGAALQKMFGVFGIGLSVGRVASFIKDQIDLADAIQKLSQRTGIAVETLAGLDHVAKKAGISLEALATANKKLSQFVIEAELGNREHQKTLETLGITARDPTERLYQLADAIKSVEDPTLRSALATKLLGKAGEEMVPMFLVGSDALKGMVEQGQRLSGITSENAKQAEKFNDDLQDMETQAGRLGLTIGSKLIPPLTILLKALTAKATGRGGDLATNLAVEIVRARVEGLAKIPVPPLEFDLDKFLAPVEQAFMTENLFPRIEGAGANITEAICRQMGGVWDGTQCNLEAGKFADKIDRQIAAIYGDVFSALREEASRGGFLPLVEGDIRRLEAAQRRRDFERETAADLDKQIRAEEEHNAALDKSAEAVRNVIDPSRLLYAEMAKLDELYRRNKLTIEEWMDATLEVQGRLDELGKETKKTTDEMTEFAKEAARGMQSAFAEEFFNILDGQMDNLGESFSRLLKRMAAELAASETMKFLTGDFGKTGEVGGLFAGMYHEGGLVGAGGPGRRVPALAFAHPQVLHDGGVAGLRDDEVPAILKKGEYVLTPEQLSGGRAGNFKVEIENRGTPNQVADAQLSFDGEAMVAKIITEDLQRGGRLSNAMARTFNLQRGR